MVHLLPLAPHPDFHRRRQRMTARHCSHGCTNRTGKNNIGLYPDSNRRTSSSSSNNDSTIHARFQLPDPVSERLVVLQPGVLRSLCRRLASRAISFSRRQQCLPNASHSHLRVRTRWQYRLCLVECW